MLTWMGKPLTRRKAPREIVLTPVREVEPLPEWAWAWMDFIAMWPTARPGSYTWLEFEGEWS